MAGARCVVVATDDGVTVSSGHFGDARFFAFYSRGGGGWRLVKLVENPYRGMHGAHGGKRLLIYSLVGGCDTIVTSSMGAGGREFFEKRGLRVVLVEPGIGVEEALRLLAAMES